MVAFLLSLSSLKTPTTTARLGSKNGRYIALFLATKFATPHGTQPHTTYRTQPNTNGSQFFLCFAETNWLDGKHVVFGKVISGLDVVSAVEQVGSDSGKTRVPVVISDSGQLR